MKKFKEITIISFLFAITLCISCEKILEDEYLLPVEAPVTKGQVVLLEDYTGQLCTNCPSAAKKISDLKELYGENLIVVAVHATGFARPLPPKYPNDYRTLEGDAWASEFGITAAPFGMINKDSGIVYNPSQWAAAVKSKIEKEPEVNLDLEVLGFDETTGNVSAKLTTMFAKTINYDMKINALILEDSITGWQKNEDPGSGTVPEIENYVFMHMLRKVAYGTWGKSFVLASDNKKSGDIVTTSIEVTLDPSWIAKNCYLVVFVSTDEPSKVGKVNYHIIQATEKAIIQK